VKVSTTLVGVDREKIRRILSSAGSTPVPVSALVGEIVQKRDLRHPLLG